MQRRIWQVMGAAMILVAAGSPIAAESLDGTVVARNGEVLSVEFQAHESTVPKTGDQVEFFKVKFGIRIDAGKGEVTRVEGDRVEVRVTEGRPQLQTSALISATGRHVRPAPRPATATRPVAPAAGTPAASAPVDHGWGTAAAVSPEQRAIDQILAAKDVCDYQTAEQLAAQARRQYPANAWLKDNYPAFQTLAQRDRNYRQALQSARYAMDNGRAADSLAHLRTAMENASSQCGQDQKVRGLHAQATQMADVQREQAAERARQESYARQQRETEQRALDEQARLRREAEAREVQQGLLDALTTLQRAEQARQPIPTPAYQGDDWLEQARPKVEQNETWQQWRKTQGW